VLLDAYNFIDVLDHRTDPPVSASWTTARSLSNLKMSPSGQHAIAFYDWDDPTAHDRQPSPGNINQVSVLYLADGATPFSGTDLRLVSVAVGYLPRDVRFSSDGTSAVVIGLESMTPLALKDLAGGIAVPGPDVPFDNTATKILIDSQATVAIVSYATSPRVDVLALKGGGTSCFTAAPNPVTDIELTADGRLVVVYGTGAANQFSAVPVSSAGSSCTPLVAPSSIGQATALAIDPSPGSTLAIAYTPNSAVLAAWIVDLPSPGTPKVSALTLEKAVSGVAFAGDGQYALLANIKVDGTPDWNGDPLLAVAKSYGVTWVDMSRMAHRLVISGTPFGAFAFVPPADNGGEGATFQTIADPVTPEVVRISHRAGFPDLWIDLAAKPLDAGYLSATHWTYVTQSHPWGRVTFIDPTGVDLRHVTGFALVEQ